MNCPQTDKRTLTKHAKTNARSTYNINVISISKSFSIKLGDHIHEICVRPVR